MFVFYNASADGEIGSTITWDEDLKIKKGGITETLKCFSFGSGLNTNGSDVANGSLFKGTDGALYYKGGSGTVTKIANP